MYVGIMACVLIHAAKRPVRAGRSLSKLPSILPKKKKHGRFIHVCFYDDSYHACSPVEPMNVGSELLEARIEKRAQAHLD